jgi:hypothetical protein
LSLSLNSRQERALLSLAMCFALAFQSIPGYSAGISVGNGASFDVGNATIDLNCLDLETAGQFVLGDGSVNAVNLLNIESTGELNGETGSLRFAGDWWNAGSFNAAQSSISMQDGCGTTESLMLGDNSFYNFSASTSTGKTLSIEAGSVQNFANELSLNGAEPNQRLKIRSSAVGQSVQFNLAAQGTQQINAVDVKDNDASAGQLLAPGMPAAYASVDAGNNKSWFEQLSDLLFKDGFESD